MVWKTNFDQLDFDDVLKSHKERSKSGPPPKVSDIPPRIQNKAHSPTRVSVNVMIQKNHVHVSLICLHRTGIWFCFAIILFIVCIIVYPFHVYKPCSLLI